MHCGPHRMYRNYGMMCFRNFPTKEERVKHLEEYKKWLEQEIKGVEEAINDIKKAS